MKKCNYPIRDIIVKLVFIFLLTTSLPVYADYAIGLFAYKHADFKLARREFQSAASNGHTMSQYYLGEIYESGMGVKQNAKVAIQWYRKAAVNNHRAAQASIASIYQRGLGVKKDNNKAFEWYTIAANNGSQLAQYELGKLYAEGIGVKTSQIEACKWLSISTSYGDPDAPASLVALIEKMSPQQIAEGTELAAEWERKREEKLKMEYSW